MTEMSKITADLLMDVTEFLWQEADMLDRKDYDAWLDLWTDTGLYIMPIGDETDYANQLNLCYDNARMRRDRIGRFQAGFSISSAPPAKTIRTISRIVIDSAEGDVIKVRAAEHLIEDKFGRQRQWAADASYTLIKTDAGFQLDGKIVKLLNSDGMLNSFSYLF
ncbi:aromatic-ring-hydroxylating dioxygenase subunit beta [Epibacterium sp. SM1969]|uniref:Aromatic-ring-hydroxylating dioxygenase subunit beta n=1 Tax=Tritonibacter aquimaris TaxID=2663379 RepID=A0A844AN91_9RHOB|nr:aromatic-ring-hydroxylating dioxygenase subunit beta [Tritonibacter aquimaris]MQY44000.1 aromatic-ring-hydroxylating dioxygenase subunit beta [Tritonibacter aquimaris]